MLVDDKKWIELWNKNIKYILPNQEEMYVDCNFTIDVSGSMSSYYENRIVTAKECISRFVGKLHQSKDKISIVSFDENAELKLPFTKLENVDIQAIISNITAEVGHGTNAEVGLKKSISLYEGTQNREQNGLYTTDDSKVLILLCDGQVNVTENTIKEARKKGIKIYTILIGTELGGKSKLEDISGNLSRSYYVKDIHQTHADTNINKLDYILKDIYDSVRYPIILTDTDNDGLADIYEERGMRVCNGKTIQTSKYNADTDGDGLLDGQEIGVIRTCSDQNFLDRLFKTEEKTVSATYFTMNSDPTKIDSDGDTINDKLDTQKLSNNYQIPDVFKMYINNQWVAMNLIDWTNDGFSMCNKSLADLLKRVGIYTTDCYAPNSPVENWYDDWYIYAIINGNKTVYSLLKMREDEDDNSYGDDDAAAVGISFAEFQINYFTERLNSKDKNIEIRTYVDNVIDSKKAKHNNTLKDYFAKTSSYASYVVAENYICKILEGREGNKVKGSRALKSITEQLDKFENIDKNIEQLEIRREELLGAHDDLNLRKELKEIEDKINWYDSASCQKDRIFRIPYALRKINENSEIKIYDENSNTIAINDINNLSVHEKQAILAAFTADISFNMFAAEVQWHAKALDEWFKANILLDGWWYSRAVIADMGLDEEDESGVYDKYYDPNYSFVKDQRWKHGDI